MGWAIDMFGTVRILVAFLAFASILSAKESGCALFGSVLNTRTGRPVPECRVKFLPADTTISTDSTGRFLLEGILPGIYRAIVIKPGFETIEISNVVVGTGVAEELTARISPSTADGILELTEKKVRSGQDNSRSTEIETAGSFRYGRNDVLRAPGALQDISMFAQSLPGVMRTNDQKTDLSVRGGGSDENAFLIDGMPIFNINHFENNNRSGGGIGNINTYFLDKVDFHTGAFSARYPDGLSSVMDISFKRGNPRQGSGLAILDAAGMGGLLEGPIPGSEGKGTLGGSLRISSLSMLDNLGLINFGGVPRYANGHLKLNYLLSGWDVSMNILGGTDGFESDTSPFLVTSGGGDSAVYLSQAVEHFHTDNLFAGARATRAMDGNSFSLYAGSNIRNFRDENLKDLALVRGGPGATTGMGSSVEEISGGNRVFWGSDWEHFLGPNATFRAGVLEEYDQPEVTVNHTSHSVRPGGLDSATRIVDSRSDSYYTLAVYGETEYMKGPWNFTGGIRILHDEYSDGYFAGPRLALIRAIGRHSLKAAFGLHTQSQAAELFSHNVPAGVTALPFNGQTILGWDWSRSSGLSTRVELFDKEGFRMLRYRPDGSARDTGRTASRGFDIYVKQSMRNQAWGSASYSYAWNRDELSGNWVPNAYSIPHSFSAALGYDFGRSLTASLHVGLASGTPFTENPAVSSQPPIDHFTQRHAPYFRIDTRLEYRHAFSKATMGSFLEITNVTDHANLFTKNEYFSTPGWGFFPVGGFTLSF